MQTILDKIAVGVVSLFVAISGLLGFNAPQENVGATIPVSVAVFQTSLASSITSTATSMDLVSGTDKAGNSLSGYICFNIDEGTALEEFVCGTVSGTAVTSMIRGISPVDGDLEVTALKKAHRRGASVKITNYPSLGIVSRILNGNETIPNLIRYATGVTPTANSDLADKEYVDGVAVAGASDANTTTKGIVEQATTAQVDAGTNLGETGAVLFASPADLAASIYGTRLPSADQKSALTGTQGTPNSTNKYVTDSDILDASGTTVSATVDDALQDFGETDVTTNQVAIAQSFVAQDNVATSVTIRKEASTGTNTGNITFDLQADNAGSPSGSDLATVTIANATWEALTSNVDYTATFSSEYTAMTEGATYWIVASSSAADDSNHPNIAKDSAGGFANGTLKYNNTADGWVDTSDDLYFKINGSFNGRAQSATSTGGFQGKNVFPKVTATGSSADYLITTNPAPASYQDGQVFIFQANHTSDDTATLNVNGLGAGDILTNDGNDTVSGDIVSGGEYVVVYRSSSGKFYLVSPTAKPAKLATGYTSKNANDTTDLTIAHGLGAIPRLVKITCIASPATNNNAMSVGTGVGVSSEQVIGITTTISDGDDTYTDASSIILLKDASGTTNVQADLKTLDSTNIVIQFTTNNNTGTVRKIIWEAFS